MVVLSGSQLILSKTFYRKQRDYASEMLSTVPSPFSTYYIFFFKVFDYKSSSSCFCEVKLSQKWNSARYGISNPPNPAIVFSFTTGTARACPFL